MQADALVERHHPPETIATTGTAWQRASGRIVVIAVATLIEAVITLGFVAISLGLGAEDQTRVGPDRPPPPVRMP